MAISQRRMLQLGGILAAWAVVVVGRLVQIQLVQHSDYVARAVRQQERTLSLTPTRGSIYDRRGRVLAESIASESIYADPQTVTDPRALAKALSSIRGLRFDRQELEKKLSGQGEFAWIARQVDPDVVREVRKMNLPGIYTLEEHKRTYPKGPLAANVIGYAGIDGEGLAGVEHSLDRYVRGRAGKVTLLRDARRGMYVVGAEGANARVDGLRVYLTIDEVIQFVSERALASAIAKYRASSGSVIVMDPSNGNILAMASWPGFDPNRFRDFTPAEWRNRAVQDQYEPGSTFKIVTAAAGLEEGVVTSSQILDCGMGKFTIGNVDIREHGGSQYGYISFEDVMVHSSNVGVIRVALALGRLRFYRYMTAFGFGQRTGVDLPGEALGTLRRPERWSRLSSAVLSMGQEIAATPLQVAAATAAIANGGKLVTPRIVERIVDSDGNAVAHPSASPPRRVVSEKTAAILNEILKAVVSRGTGMGAALPDYVVAGKTGTAQKAARGGYSPDRFVASFAGWVPADRPRLVILVVIDEPIGSQYGGTVAAPVFREIAETSLRYLGVAPSLPTRRLVPAAVLARDPRAVAGRSAGSLCPRSATPCPWTPDLRGLDARSALAEATSLGYRVTAQGTGVVVSQSPAPGAPRPADSELALRLSSRSESS